MILAHTSCVCTGTYRSRYRPQQNSTLHLITLHPPGPSCRASKSESRQSPRPPQYAAARVGGGAPRRGPATRASPTRTRSRQNLRLAPRASRARLGSLTLFTGSRKADSAGCPQVCSMILSQLHPAICSWGCRWLSYLDSTRQPGPGRALQPGQGRARLARLARLPG